MGMEGLLPSPPPPPPSRSSSHDLCCSEEDGGRIENCANAAPPFFPGNGEKALLV